MTPPSPDGAAAARRARGEARAVFARAGARTEPARVFETGGLRLRFPRAMAACEAVLVNTGGGMAGGDRAMIALTLEAGAQVLMTTQSAEKIYRSDGETTEVDARVSIGAGAALEWMPQETILFERARFARRLTIDLAPDASLLLVEAVTFGRIAMGEFSIEASLRELLAGAARRPACLRRRIAARPGGGDSRPPGGGARRARDRLDLDRGA